MTAQNRIRGRMPIVLPLSAIGRSHLGNPGSDVSAILGGLVPQWNPIADIDKVFTLFESPSEGERHGKQA